MESIINNPGLQHLAERIFLNLDTEHLKICRLINQSCKQILENPFFWLKKFKNLSKENQKDWIKILKEVKNSEKIHAIISYLQWNLKKEAVSAIAVDLQCYTSPAVQDNLRKMIIESCKKQESSAENTEIVKILAPLTDNPNAPDEYGETPILMATYRGHTEIVKILAPLTDNPNAPDEYGETPIIMATCRGYTEIVKILAPLTDNPNASNKYGMTPISIANHYFKCPDIRREYYIASGLRFSAKEIIKILQNIHNQSNQEMM